MEITFQLNGKKITHSIESDTILLDLLRELKCYSVKRGCETSNCGLCTVFVNEKPVLSCSTIAARVVHMWQTKVPNSVDSVIRDL